MKKAIKRKKTFTVLAIATFLVAVLLLIPLYFMFSSSNYIAMIPFGVISIISFYANVFFAFAAYDLKVMLRVIPIIDEFGSENVSSIAERIGWRQIATEKFIKKCKKHGYIQ